ncbi:ketohydroxyglutarate aldolase [Nocardioides sp. OK12]|uniref:bifunctional 4-hydroxy-2-oxoglutarate aldolase/2-dehydro-3-deoxy-phosphogluconate aldolase n=1 Tax=Nocardioides sp. OK12 TaxID=2758661 RepID=UPI0021C3BDE7|nr:bifunctional 4-hydroxy-2-oxoglutarate aldolase/2-dehydro-3-deoxy-phosphogluconate aldolase [Nocardioides sp. OK12]GHJ57587.1 ketohydroxyglutarate aldolase [Nocardioides sp. OK12]
MTATTEIANATGPDLRTLLPGPSVLAVLRTRTARTAVEMAAPLKAGGITVLEVTTTVPDAAGVIRELAGDPELLVGAGTVTTTAQLDAVLAAGSRFVVSPGLDEDVLVAGLAAGVPTVPGVLTPTEVIRARALGAGTIKLFPADTVGIAHLRALQSVFPDTGFIPTGGVDATSIAGWLGAGPVAVGVGSVLEKTYVDHGAAALEALAAELVAHLEKH